MINKKVENALLKQVALEAYASMSYLAMASWMDCKGYEGTAQFLYAQSEEERGHMLKIFHYINDAGGTAIVPELKKPKESYDSYIACFDQILIQEIEVSNAIHSLVDLSINEKDHTTNNFLQWYVSEQLEEESQFRTIIDKIKILGKDGSGLYLLDKDLGTMATAVAVLPAE
jgi:ferritin